LKKATACLLIVMLVFTFAPAYLPQTVTAPIMTLTWLTHWTEPSEVKYWGPVLAKYLAETGVEIDRQTVEFDALYETIMIRHAGNEDPDLIHIHTMWIPELANWKANILSVPPDPVQADVGENWTEATADASTWKGFTWGYPTEFNSWALVYNEMLFNNTIAGLEDPDKTFLTNVRNKLNNDENITYTELTNAAILLTKGTPPAITQTGFAPFIEGMPEEQRFQFLSLLWSNGGEYVDLTVPEATFDGTEGYEVMQLYHDLGFVHQVYDPMNMPDYWWGAWSGETVAMMILPTWMSYVRDAMGDNFTHLEIAPIPVGPSGSNSKSVTFSWSNVVTKRAENLGRDDEAWDFLEWLNTPRPQGYIDDTGGGGVGLIPRANDTSIMGDFLAYDSIVPSRITDRENARTWDKDNPGCVGDSIAEDFWFAEFMKFGSPPYGRSDKTFLNAEEAQYEIGLMFETITLTNVTSVQARVNLAADNIDAILPMAGDVNMDGPVDIYDAVLMVRDIDAVPGAPNWNIGRCDINDNGVVGLADVILLSTNYGKTGGY